MKPWVKGILYAVGWNFLIVLLPISLGLSDILQSYNAGLYKVVYSRFHILAENLACYSVIGCPANIAYVVFLFEWISLTAVTYAISVWKISGIPDRKKFILGFIIAFPLASYFMSQVMVLILFVAEVLKLGFV